MEHLLTIGQLGKLSNIHTKALRYYEQIGILTPNRINPDTGYRYYSYAHIPYVKMIKLCASYEIPLQTFRDFVKDKDTIDLDKLLSLAEDTILKKLAATKADLDQIQHLQKRLDQSKQIDQFQKVRHTEKTQTFWLLPFSGKIFDRDYYKLTASALFNLQAVNCQTQHKIGLCYDLTGSLGGNQLAIQISDQHKRPQKGTWLELPAANFVSRHIQVHEITELLQTLTADYCFVWETFEANYRLTEPHLEMTYPSEN